jgi:hypothetical protein
MGFWNTSLMSLQRSGVEVRRRNNAQWGNHHDRDRTSIEETVWRTKKRPQTKERIVVNSKGEKLPHQTQIDPLPNNRTPKAELEDAL